MVSLFCSVGGSPGSCESERPGGCEGKGWIQGDWWREKGLVAIVNYTHILYCNSIDIIFLDCIS